MSGEIKIKSGNKPTAWARPEWEYNRTSDGSSDSIAFSSLEMLESCRNVLEQIARSQMLQCDVRHAIIEMSRAIKRIDRRLAKVEKLR